MATDNRNNPSGAPDGGQQNQSGGEDRNQQGNEENPQQGAQWDNYQTRSLSSEGGDKIEESDLLRADEASTQQTGNGNS